MLLTPQQMADAEQALFATGVEAEPLMDRAGRGIAEAAMQFNPKPGTAVAFVGNGHNGGDALVALRHLRDAGWRPAVRFAHSAEALKPLTRKKLEQLGSDDFSGEKLEPSRGEPLLLIDGLLGIGARGELRPEYLAAAKELNALRRKYAGNTVAVDIPSGVDGFTGKPCRGAVVADLTCAIAYLKTGVVADDAIDHVGRIALIPLEEIVATAGSGDPSAILATARAFGARIDRRPFGIHKGGAGRVSIIAGSRGMSGAAVLTASAALRGGAGLVTLFCDEALQAGLAAATPPEVMVSAVSSMAEADAVEADVLAVGPGLGPQPLPGLLDLVASSEKPMVIDADALNLLARESDLSPLRDAGELRLLTPHPGEMKRLEESAGLPWAGSRRHRTERLARHLRCPVLLKGARTVFVYDERVEPTVFNTTGHPGMATPGVGDTLTGLLAALIGSGAGGFEAGVIGSWVNGRAAELAVRDGGQSAESLIASDLPRFYGKAFGDLRRSAF